MIDLAQYPGITRAMIEIGYDNGIINRCRSEDDLKVCLATWLADRDTQNTWGTKLQSIDAWLNSKTDAELEVACCGENTAMHASLESAPEGTYSLLDDLFNDVAL